MRPLAHSQLAVWLECLFLDPRSTSAPNSCIPLRPSLLRRASNCTVPELAQSAVKAFFCGVAVAVFAGLVVWFIGH
jgi:hypothetical protein